MPMSSSCCVARQRLSVAVIRWKQRCCINGPFRLAVVLLPCPPIWCGFGVERGGRSWRHDSGLVSYVDETPVSRGVFTVRVGFRVGPGSSMCRLPCAVPQARLRADCASLWADSVPPQTEWRIVWFCLISFLAFKFWLFWTAPPGRTACMGPVTGLSLARGRAVCTRHRPSFSLRFITVSYSTCNATRV